MLTKLRHGCGVQKLGRSADRFRVEV